MKTFFHKHPETILVACVIVFLAVIVGAYFWGVNDIIAEVNKAFNYAPPQTATGFNLQDAAKIDWRGLVQ